jgi:hypothetical protein
VIDHGTIVFEGTVDAFKAAPEIKNRYLAV